MPTDEASREPLPEPWLRGILPDLHPVIGHLLRASEQIREDIAAAVSGLDGEHLWAKPDGMTPAGFHLKHLAGSTDRLSTYLEGRVLSREQLEQMKREQACGESADELLTHVARAFDRYEGLVRALRPEQFGQVREVGRKKLPVTAIGLAIHIVEHGQRHVGQTISATKRVRL